MMARRIAQRDAPSAAVDAQVNEVAASDRQVAVDIAALWHVADGGIAWGRALAEHLEASRRWRQEAEQQPKEGGLPAPVRTEGGDEFAGSNGEGGVLPDQPVAISCRQMVRGDHGRGGRLGRHRSVQCVRACAFSAFCKVSSWAPCHSWNVASTGCSVSETPTIGMPLLAACRFRSSVMFVEAWTLKTSTLIFLVATRS